MRKKALREVLRKVDRVISDPRVNADQRDQLLLARQELAQVARSGKLNRQKVYRLVGLIANVLLDVIRE